MESVNISIKKTLRRNGLAYNIWKYRNGYFFIGPLIIGLAIFCYYPPISGIYRSFFEWSGIGQATYIGLDNYKQLFQDEIFINSIPTMFMIMIPRLIIGITVPLIMAELIFCVKAKKIQGIYRVAILLPIVAPGVIGQLIWKNIYEPNSGLLVSILKVIGVVPHDAVMSWLSDPALVIFAVIFLGFPWVGGTSVLIYMSGLMNISTEMVEASKLDGANTFQRIWKIDIPLLMGQIRYFLIFGIINGLQDYGTQILLTQGGPGYKTFVPGYYMYIEAFTVGKMGYACAIGSSLFFAIIVFTLIAYRFLRTNNDN